MRHEGGASSGSESLWRIAVGAHNGYVVSAIARSGQRYVERGSARLEVCGECDRGGRDGTLSVALQGASPSVSRCVVT